MLGKRIEELRETESSLALHIKTLQDELNAQVSLHETHLKQIRAESIKQSQNIANVNSQSITKQKSLWEKLEKDINTLQAQLHSLNSEKENLVQQHHRKRVLKEEYHAKSLSVMKGTYMRQEKSKRESWMASELLNIQQSARKATEPEIALLLHQQKEELKRRRQQKEENLQMEFQDKEAALNKEEDELKQWYDTEMASRVQDIRKQTKMQIDSISSRVMESGFEEATQQSLTRRHLQEEHWRRELNLVHEDREILRKRRLQLSEALRVLKLPAPPIKEEEEKIDSEILFAEKYSHVERCSKEALENQKREIHKENMVFKQKELQKLVSHYESLGVGVLRNMQLDQRQQTAHLRRIQEDLEKLQSHITELRNGDYLTEKERITQEIKTIQEKIAFEKLEDKKLFRELQEQHELLCQSVQREGQSSLEALPEDSSQYEFQVKQIEEEHEALIEHLKKQHESNVMKLKMQVEHEVLPLHEKAESLTQALQHWTLQSATFENELRSLVENFS